MNERNYPEEVTCGICGIPIPSSIVSPTHPLFGTIDHVRPKGKGGEDISENRQPAHRICNLIKGCDELDDLIRVRCREAVKSVFPVTRAVPPTKRYRKAYKALGIEIEVEGEEFRFGGDESAEA
jgi:hypothetical protein